MELRLLMSARSAGQTSDLRAEVREKLIEFLQREHPEALPRSRLISVGQEDVAQNSSKEAKTEGRSVSGR